jgi:hypothetical protein
MLKHNQYVLLSRDASSRAPERAGADYSDTKNRPFVITGSQV